MRAWGLTDRGMVRSENQDAFAIRKLSDSSLLAVVCDGMGGAHGGNVASALALEIFTAEVLRGYKESMKPSKCESLFRQAAEKANAVVYERAQDDANYNGMGTTLVAAVVRGSTALVLNVGDSRAYHIGKKGIMPVTTDHSFVELLVQKGELTKEEARNHPNKNLITRAVGTEAQVQADLFQVKLEEQDCLILCSDGLSNLMADQEILFEIVHGGEKADCCHRLLEIARHRGAPDNVTVVLVSQ